MIALLVKCCPMACSHLSKKKTWTKSYLHGPNGSTRCDEFTMSEISMIVLASRQVDRMLSWKFPRALMLELYNEKCGVVYKHVFEKYDGEGKSVYGVA